MNHETQGLPPIHDHSPLRGIVETAMSLAEELISESHKADSEGRVPDEEERAEFLQTATQLAAALIIGRATVRRWNRNLLSPGAK